MAKNYENLYKVCRQLLPNLLVITLGLAMGKS